jgi:WD40 repeat protein
MSTRLMIASQTSSADDGAVTRTFEVGEEEVNHVAVHPRGELLAAANDAGEIAVVKLATGLKQRTLRRVHTNIVSSVAWRPNRATELLTASLDSTAVVWDVSNGSVKRSWVLRDVIADVQLREEDAHNGGQEHSEQSLQMINPPLGHSVRMLLQSGVLAELVLTCDAPPGCCRKGQPQRPVCCRRQW